MDATAMCGSDKHGWLKENGIERRGGGRSQHERQGITRGLGCYNLVLLDIEHSDKKLVIYFAKIGAVHYWDPSFYYVYYGVPEVTFRSPF